MTRIFCSNSLLRTRGKLLLRRVDRIWEFFGFFVMFFWRSVKDFFQSNLSPRMRNRQTNSMCTLTFTFSLVYFFSEEVRRSQHTMNVYVFSGPPLCSPPPELWLAVHVPVCQSFFQIAWINFRVSVLPNEFV